MATDNFFQQTSDQSRVKAAIVAKYFEAWARVIIPTAKKGVGRIAYIDLFAGPGRYEDGTASTPLKILEHAINDPDLRTMLVTRFNDGDANHSRSLEAEIHKLPNIASLTHAPIVHNDEVGDKIVETLEGMRLVPTLFFVDPWGYKGLSLRLVNSVLKDWGCDCIFFFNYNRISMGLSNPLVKQHMDSLFGEEGGQRVRERLDASDPSDRELVIVEELSEALRAHGGQYVLPFRFRDERGSRTSHHLILVTKHVRGYTIMKDIMARESSRTEQGVSSFEYNPADHRFPVLFELARPLEDLEKMLQNAFAGQTLTMLDVFDRHHVGRPFLKRNYKAALRSLEEKGLVATKPRADERKKGTFADHVKVRFPGRS